MGDCLTTVKLSQGVSEAKHHCFVENNSQINLFVWDPTESVATRPLFMLSNPGSYKFFYTFDGNKNVSELVHFETRNGIAAHYDYAPFGTVTRVVNTSAISARDLEQKFREMLDLAEFAPETFSSLVVCQRNMARKSIKFENQFMDWSNDYTQREKAKLIPKFADNGEFDVRGNYL